MCLIFLAYQAHPRFPLVAAANRDEYFARPTAPAAFWGDAPGILAGRDLQAGGTWLGVTRNGRFAALTNFRQPGAVIPAAPSRGDLVSDFLRATLSPVDYAGELAGRAGAYNGFNLLVGNGEQLVWYSNHGPAPQALPPGVYGLSNHLLDTPWPKVEAGKARFRSALAADVPDRKALFDLLGSRDVPAADLLPDTGVGQAMERVLACAFIRGEFYGTRSSTVIRVGQAGRVNFAERTFAADGSPLEMAEFEFAAATAT